jgi:succinoglycan biosynthesis transport protein ExoP
MSEGSSTPPVDQFPLARTRPSARCDARLVSLLRPDSYDAEQYRCLRHAILRQLTPGKCNVIAVSSPNRGSAKATTAINLAASLVEPGVFRVLLIDADLRSASIASQLALDPVADDGLDTALADWSLRLGDFVRYVPHPDGLTVLPTAPRPDTAGHLVASPRFGMLLMEARQQYDFVIVHTPPLVPTADCRAMARWIDGFVVVVTAHKTTREHLEEALNVMSEEQVLGLVFCEADRGSAHEKEWRNARD